MSGVTKVPQTPYRTAVVVPTPKVPLWLVVRGPLIRLGTCVGIAAGAIADSALSIFVHKIPDQFGVCVVLIWIIQFIFGISFVFMKCNSLSGRLYDLSWSKMLLMIVWMPIVLPVIDIRRLATWIWTGV